MGVNTAMDNTAGVSIFADACAHSIFFLAASIFALRSAV